ncbi:NHLP bacteriocin system secretion protein [Nostocales cyanobacterium HT-58-2]|nr:NHLP bacteriocin system secretion protein [Nostocales cyanobacterium HT-58-2]
MQNQQQSLFRQKSLARLSSPEKLDQLLQITSPRGWMVLSCMSSLLLLAVVWSIFGRLPVTVAGQGVLVRPGKVVDFQSPGAGQLQSLKVKVGDFVQKGQVLGTVAQPELEKKLQQQQAKLTELQAQNQEANSLQTQRTRLEQRSLQQQRQNLQNRIREAQTLTPILQTKGKESIQQQRQNVQQHIQEAQALTPVLKERLNRRKELQKSGAISSDALLEAEQLYFDSVRQISNLKAELKGLDLKEVEAERSYRENLTTIADLKAQLQAIDNQETKLAQQNLEASVTRTNQIQEVNRAIAQLKLQLVQNTQIVSNHTGRILELAVKEGQIFSAGTRLGSIEAEDKNRPLVALTYFPVRDGKRIKTGMKLQVTPDTVKREQFGGVIGTVKTISAFPITRQGATSQVGNPELVQNLTAQGAQIEILAELEPDPSTFSHYHWSSSKGPQLQLSPGTTTSVRVTVEEQAPITLVLPILRTFTGIY